MHIALALVVVVAAVTDSGTTTVRARRHECTVAIALRDFVPVEQMVGTMLFTRPLLAAGYDEHVYLEATDVDDGRERFVAAMQRAHDEDCTVDLFFLAHGGQFVSWVESIAVDQRPRMRLVYDTGAGDSSQGDRWIDVGARAFVGHPGGNVAPVFYAYFMPTWLGGASLTEAVAVANRKTFVTLDAARPYLGAETGALWRGTRAQMFGDVSAHH
jgi:hypothetical protein